MISFMAVIILTSAVLAAITALYVNNLLLEEVQTRVRLDLNSARDIYNNHVEHIATILRATSVRRTIIFPLKEEVKGDLGKVLQTLRLEGGMDMVTLVDTQGRVIYRAHNPKSYGDSLSDITIIAKVLKEKNPASGTIIVPKEVLEREGAEIATRARFKIKETPGARPIERKFEESGMVIMAAVPFTSVQEGGRMLGVLVGANLLNHQYEIVDKIKDEVFQDQVYKGIDIGTATIFQNDLRISTNVRNEDGSRAIGTRLSAEVYEHVLEKGLVWSAEAFVVNNWYISAYEPIKDPDGEIIGALYVGLLKEPFTKPQKVIIIFFFIGVTAAAIASLVLIFFVTEKTLKPIDRIISMCQKVVKGDLSARVGITPSGEMGVLCEAIDHMAEAIDEREKKLEMATREQIGQSEKLASIGRLAAGIAHEINNPLTGVLTFSHLLKEKNDINEESKKDLDVIIRETSRVREIVRGLLDFSRQSPPKKEHLDINNIIRQMIALVKSQKEFRKVAVKEDLSDGIPMMEGDKNQLQQVFLNLTLNACEAMPDGGTLTISTCAKEEKIIINFTDTGCGIKEEDLDKLYDPFFTTKPIGKGTGLGLSVTYGNVQQHGGSIEVESKVGRGTKFTVIFPIGIKDHLGT